MKEVVSSSAVFFSYALLAIFAQNAVFTRALGVSRMVQLVGDDRTSSALFGMMLCITQVLVAPLAFLAGRFIAPLDNRAQLRPLVYIASIAVVCLAEHLVLMDAGKVVQQGTPLSMLTAPANDFVQTFFGRSELGVRLLSLRTVGDFTRRGEHSDGEPLVDEMTLRDALSVFVARGCDVLPVVTLQGLPCGTLHFRDLLSEMPTRETSC